MFEPLTAAVPCPLLVVRNERTAPYRKVVVGAAPTLEIRRVLEAAMTIAPIAHYTLLRVVNFPGGYVPDLLPETPSDKEVKAVLGDFILPEGQHDWLVRCGKAKGEIVFAAREVKADLVALGNTLRTGLEKMLLGSVAMETIGSLNCDVIIVHSEDHLP
jgi:nucleotide-binding universal stress UspA family protein